MIGLALATGALVLAAVLFAATLRPRGLVAATVSTWLLLEALIVISVGVAGLLIRSLQPVVLEAIAGAWLAMALVITWRRGPGRDEWAAAGRALARKLRGWLGEPALISGAVLLLAGLAWRVFIASRLPLVDYDGWSYHLVFADVWLQHDALTSVPQRIWTAGYPADGEIVTTWLMAFTRSDAFAGYSSILALPLAIAAVAGVARLLGARPVAAGLAGVLFGMIPAFIVEAGTSYTDTASVAFAASAWYLGLRALRGERTLATVLLLGLAGGLAVGTKATNVLLVVPILVAVGVALLWDAARSREAARRAIVGAVILVVTTSALGFSWYLKDLLVYGNPLYPIAVGPFAGPTSLTAFSIHDPNLRGMGRVGQVLTSWSWDWRVDRYDYNVRPGGFGRAWLVELVVAVAGAAVLLRRRRWAGLLLVIVPAGVVLATMPMPWYARLSLFVPAVALAAAAVGLDRLPGRLRKAASVGLVILAAFSFGVANVRPNVDIGHAIGRQSGWARTSEYLAYLANPSAAQRARISLRADCQGFETMPDGAVVAPAGFNLLHAAVGPGLTRTLTDPLAITTDPATLAAEARAVGAGWIVTDTDPNTDTGGNLDGVASQAPHLFELAATTCRGARIWKVAATP